MGGGEGYEVAMFRKAGILIAIAVLACFPCASQYKPRPVTGVVTDKAGNALPGAIVQIENTRNLAVRSYITQKDGRYYFSELNDDIDYTLRAKYRSNWSEPKTLSRFNTSPHPEINLVIPID
jgi:Carboxypeptidase regulatory-like domain